MGVFFIMEKKPRRQAKRRPQPKKRSVKKRRPKKRKRKITWKGRIRRLIASLVFLAIVFICFVLGLVIIYARQAPALDNNYLISSGTTTIYDRQGQKIFSLGLQKRQPVKANEIPSQLADAVTSIEDRHFYKHFGLDPVRILGAAVADLKHPDRALQGGSTLDQQLIKLSYFSTKKSDQTFKRKAQEAWLALQLDHQYSKADILKFYVNKVFMGNGIYGMQTAANYYYGKDLADLSLAQTATIAGIPNAPSTYNPYSDLQKATKRRNTVLKAMLANKKISQPAYLAAINEDISSGLVPKASHAQSQTNQKAILADPYLKQVLSSAKQAGYDPYRSDLKIYTNLDMQVQTKLYQLANSNELAYPNDQLQVGASVVDPKTGAILGMIGARKVDNVTFGFNRAVQTSRTNASTAKPLFDYAPAIEYLEWPTYHELDDGPYTYAGTDKELHDFDNRHLGKMTMQDALIQSRNIPAIRALEAVGITRAQNFISQLGFTYPNNLELQNGIGLPSSSLQNAAAYAAFANGGTYYEPRYITKIVLPTGETRKFTSKKKQVMQASTAYMITAMLKDVIYSGAGTGRAASIPNFYQAGKTGTNAYPADVTTNFPSDALMDAWFNGYTKNFSISVWMGYDNPYQPNHYLTPAQSQLPIEFYRHLIEAISQGLPNQDWARPSDVATKVINGKTYYYLTADDDDASDSFNVPASSSSSLGGFASTTTSSATSSLSSASASNATSSLNSSSSQLSSQTSQTSVTSSSQASSSQASLTPSSSSSEETLTP